MKNKITVTIAGRPYTLVTTDDQTGVETAAAQVDQMMTSVLQQSHVSALDAAVLTAVGENSFASKLTIEAKKSKNRGKSEMMAALTRFAMVMGILFIPLGVAMIVKEFFILDQSYRDGVVHTVGALGNVAEGLVEP